MTDLKEKLVRLIEMQGPLNISHFMALALADPKYGYYKTAMPFGQQGDFTTAPEISQMFGEMMAIWLISTWQASGSPPAFILCEMGPGRGTLMDDILRTVKKMAPDCFQSAQIYLVETSLKLQNIQKEKLARHSSTIQWIEHFSQLPQLPLLLVANELFDCLPIHQYVRYKNDYRERVISLNDKGELIFSAGFGSVDPALIPIHAHQMPEGTIIEISPARLGLMQTISEHIVKNRGSALIIDYGTLEHGFGDTLQAMSKHNYSDVLANPGQDDLTSHVDFAALADIARHSGCQTSALLQGQFLIELGLLERAGRLGHGKDYAFQQKISHDVERLASDEHMGTLFKVLCVADIKTKAFPFSDWQTNTKHSEMK